MAMEIKHYDLVKHLIQTGDCIAWNGWGHNTIEWLYSIGIKIATGPITHISTAIWVQIGDKDVLFLAETMALGTLFDSLDRRINMANSENWTQCWWLPLSDERRARFDEQAAKSYMIRKVEEGTPYDVLQGIRSAFDEWGLGRQHNPRDDTKLFCSELHMFILSAGRAVKDCNASEAHPTDVARFDIHAPTYYQIFGNKLELQNVNTVCPDGWDM